MTSLNDGRSHFIDYGKAIIILIVIMTHFKAPFLDVGAFNMMFFFFASGYVQKKGGAIVRGKHKAQVPGNNCSLLVRNVDTRFARDPSCLLLRIR